MADGKVVIDVILDDGKVAKGVADVDKSIGGLDGSAKKASASIGKIASALGLVYLAKKGIDMVRDALDGAFNRIDTMEQFERVMGVMVDNTDAVAGSMDRLQDIVEGTSMRTDVMAQGIQNFVTRGMEIDKATDTVEAWGNAVAFYGDGSNEQFDNVSNALQNMVAKGTVGMDQLNRLYEAGIPATEIYADATGKSVEEVSQALSDGEISAEDFVNTVSDAMMEGTENFPEISSAMKDMGMSWGSVMDNMGAYVEMGVTDIITAIDDMLENNGLPDMRSMLDNFGQAFGDTLSSIAEAVPGIADKIMVFVDKIREWKGVLDEVMNYFQPFREAFMNAFSSLVESFGPIWESLKGLFESLEPILMSIGIIVGTVLVGAFGIFSGMLSGVISAIGPFIAALINAVDFVVEFVLLIVALLTLDFPEALEIWNQMTETAIQFFTNLWDGVVNFFSSFIETIVGFFEGLYNILVGNSIIPDMVEAIVQWFQDMFQWVIDIVKSIVDGVVNFFESLYDGVKSIFGAVKDFISDVWNSIKSTVVEVVTSLVDQAKQNFESMKNSIQTILSTAKNIISNIWNSIKSTVTSVVNGVKNTVTSVWNSIKSTISSVMSSISSTISSIWNSIKSTVSGVVNSIKSTVSNIFNSLRGVVSSAFSGVKNAVRTGINGALDIVKNIKDKFLDAGKNIVSSIADGITGGVKKVTDAIGGVAQKARDFLPFSPPKTGPLKDIMDVKWGETIGTGIERGENKAAQSMRNLAGALNDEMDPEFDFIQPRLRGAKPSLGVVGQPVVSETVREVRNKKRHNDEKVIIIKPSNVEMDGRTVGEITWEVVDENIERNKGILDRFRG